MTNDHHDHHNAPRTEASPMHRRITVAALAAAALAVPAAADAHVTLQPNTATAGGFTVVAVRVPNERDNASTTRVRLVVPDGFYAASYEAQPGWRVRVTKTRLATPVTTPDGPISERVSAITWIGTGKGMGRIRPGQFRDFRISVKMPDTPATLTFPAYQRYSSGEMVPWTGAPGSEHPAPRLTLAAPVTSG
jgi:uncharacterized protein YcnI